MDLSTKYLGLTLKNPFVVASSPLSDKLDTIKDLEDAGAAAVVMFSLFEEQIRHEQGNMAHFMEMGKRHSEVLGFFPQQSEYKAGPSEYLEKIRAATAACSIPIIGSINGVTDEGWIDYARNIQDAGAKALELNVYWLPTKKGQKARDVERRYIDVLTAVKKSVTIPVAVKLSPYFSSIGEMAKRLAKVGTNGLVLFNRFYQPDFDLDKQEVVSRLSHSTSAELRLALLWISVLHGRLPRSVSLVATGGIHSGKDMAKVILAGGDACQCASVLLNRGVGHVGVMLDELETWMVEKEYKSIKEMKGAMSQKKVGNAEAFERANYIKVLGSYIPKNPS